MIGSSIRLYVSCSLQPCAGWVGWRFHKLTRVPLQVLFGKFSIWTLGPYNCATVDILQVKAISPCPFKIWVLDLGVQSRSVTTLKVVISEFHGQWCPREWHQHSGLTLFLLLHFHAYEVLWVRPFSCHLLGQIQILGEFSMTLKLDCSLNCLDIPSHHVLCKHWRCLSFFLLTLHLSSLSSQDIILSWIHPNPPWILVLQSLP